MKRLFIILIIAMLSPSTQAGVLTCAESLSVVVTNPERGHKTLHDAVMVSGYTCERSPVVMVKNLTTKKTSFVATDKVCDRRGCTYRFSVAVRGLAMGRNRISVAVAGQNPLKETITEVIRTALAGL